MDLLKSKSFFLDYGNKNGFLMNPRKFSTSFKEITRRNKYLNSFPALWFQRFFVIFDFSRPEANITQKYLCSNISFCDLQIQGMGNRANTYTFP